jgi:hypothetical protein
MMNPYSLKSISTTYPGFQALPKGIKQLLVVTESFYFDEARPQQPEHGEHHEIPPEVLHLANAGAPYQATQPPIRAGL